MYTLFFGAAAADAGADEGMWLFNALPVETLAERYEFTPTSAWLDRVREASVRLNSGSSGAFVSADGLLITNQHVGAHAIQKLGDEQCDYVRDGFYARTREEELRCADLEAEVLVSIEDVTGRVNGAVKAGASAAEAYAARQTIRAEIEQESLARTGLRSEVVLLYRGAEHHLYRYRRYTDVRLVFAPEQRIAAFGGDPDNFEFPRYGFDVCFFRVYENGQPARVPYHLPWAQDGVRHQEFVAVSGHPSFSTRLFTVVELEGQRDIRVPQVLKYVKTFEVALATYSARSAECARRAQDELFGFRNARKAFDGRMAALLTPELFARKRREEEELKAFARNRPEFAEYLSTWDDIARAQHVMDDVVVQHNLLEAGNFNSALFEIARKLYRSRIESEKPNGERLREYRDSGRAELELAIFSARPIYDDFEILKLTQFFTFLAQELGVEDAQVDTILGGRSPAQCAAELVKGTKLHEIAFRRRLYAMRAEEIMAVDDPLIVLAREIDLPARELRKTAFEHKELKEQAHAKLAQIRYAKEGARVSPDATSTLRFSFGKVSGYEERGAWVEPFTTLAGKFARSAAQEGREPFSLPKSWLAAKDTLNLATPYNFVSTCDIIGGNSGSPTLNRRGEFVGLVFDGNLQWLGSDYAYSETQARAISLDARAIVEVLRKVYRADELVNELVGP